MDEDEIKQYIILRKDAKTVTGEPVSPYKLAVMTSHASMAFLTNMIKQSAKKVDYSDYYMANLLIDSELYEGWITGIFTKVLLAAKNLNDLNKAVRKAEELGLKEGIDFVKIEDACLTELVPDEGSDRCFIAIGFKPMKVSKIRDLTKKYQLYR